MSKAKAYLLSRMILWNVLVIKYDQTLPCNYIRNILSARVEKERPLKDLSIN